MYSFRTRKTVGDRTDPVGMNLTGKSNYSPFNQITLLLTVGLKAFISDVVLGCFVVVFFLFWGGRGGP